MTEKTKKRQVPADALAVWKKDDYHLVDGPMFEHPVMCLTATDAATLIQKKLMPKVAVEQVSEFDNVRSD